MYNKPSPQEYLRYCRKPSPQEYLQHCRGPSLQKHLAHHGILGQKWGKRNGPPYPLGASSHSASERKAGWRKSLDRGGKREDNGARQKSGEGRAPQKKGLTDRQKQALKIGAAIAVTALGIYGGYKLKQSGKLDPLIEKGKKLTEDILAKMGGASAGTLGSFSALAGAASSAEGKGSSADQKIYRKIDGQIIPDGFRSIGRRESIREAVKKVNPSGSNTNCRACSIASVLRIRGLDVEAVGSVQGGYLHEAVAACFKGAKKIKIYSPSKERVTSYILKSCGEDSSGVMVARYNTYKGKVIHAISWMAKGGAVSFFDGQKGLADCSMYLDMLDSSVLAEIIRLDNLELNPDGIGKYIKSR